MENCRTLPPYKVHVVPFSQCPLCSNAIENQEHLFLSCPISSIIWRSSPWPLDMLQLPFSDITQWIKVILDPKIVLESLTANLHHFQLFASNALDLTWMARNRVIHEGATADPVSLASSFFNQNIQPLFDRNSGTRKAMGDQFLHRSKWVQESAHY